MLTWKAHQQFHFGAGTGCRSIINWLVIIGKLIDFFNWFFTAKRFWFKIFKCPIQLNGKKWQDQDHRKRRWFYSVDYITTTKKWPATFRGFRHFAIAGTVLFYQSCSFELYSRWLEVKKNCVLPWSRRLEIDARHTVAGAPHSHSRRNPGGRQDNKRGRVL